jgi:sialic acid synthase
MLINYKNPTIIAEIGCNHKGDIKIAKKMIEVASSCGASYVKFQKRDNKYLLKERYNIPHPVPENSYGKTYGLHREFLEFNMKQHLELYKFCLKKKIKYSVSVWEKKSAINFIKSKIKLDYIKVPSACNFDFELLEVLCKKFKNKIHISLGMTSFDEIKKIAKFVKNYKRLNDVVFYACTSDYPASFDNTKLLEITSLRSQYLKKVNDIAFSGHHLGIGIDIAAYTLGANIIERHFTLDRTWKGTDHAASLEPQGLEKLVRELKNSYKSLKFKKGNGILTAEKFQRKNLKQM